MMSDAQDPALQQQGGGNAAAAAQRSEMLQPGTVVPSQNYPGGRSVVMEDRPDYAGRRLAEERVTRDWEYVTVARPVDLHEKIYEVPTRRTVQTFVPKIQVREVVKTIPKDQPEYVEKHVEIPHAKIVDKYVEVPVTAGTEIKYVPRIEVRERTVKVTKPEIKWVEKVIEVPQIKEVVRYIESDKNVEQVIRYVPKGEEGETATELVQQFLEARGKLGPEYAEGSMPQRDDGPHIPFTPREIRPLGGPAPQASMRSPRFTPRLDQVEQLFIPRVTKTVEVEKEIPVSVDVPVPFMVPKPIQVPVEVPVIRFRDHFVPVPVRRHVIPRILFTEDVYEVECTKEKPVLVIEDQFKPVPVDVKIRLKEKDIKVLPIDPAELSQADQHAMWMRVNADLLERAKAQGRAFDTYKKDKNNPGSNSGSNPGSNPGNNPGDSDCSAQNNENNNDADTNTDCDDDVRDPTTTPDFGPLPLHPGHPLMMTFLQSQWIQNPSTVTHNMYTPEFFHMHASALDSILHPQPHQVNVTQEQSVRLGPLPAEQLPSPWTDIGLEDRRKGIRAYTQEEVEDRASGEVPLGDEAQYVVRRGACGPCCAM